MKTEYSEEIKHKPGNYKFFEFNKKLIITREDGIPYLIRHTLFTIGKYFSVKIHDIVQSDDACLHDHPWSFLSIILKGGYYEWTPIDRDLKPWERRSDDFKQAPDGEAIQRKWYGPGSVLWRPNPWPHRLELETEIKGAPYYMLIRKPIPCKTLVFTFKVNRKWGFFTKSGWKYWREYNKKQHC